MKRIDEILKATEADRNEILALSVVLAIDAVISQARAASASSGVGSSSS